MNRTLSIFAALMMTTTPALAGQSHQEVRVELNGQAHVLTLDDLEEGESRTLGEGDHQVTVTRDGDQLRVTHPNLDLGGAGEVIALPGDGDPELNVELPEGATAKKVMFISDDGSTQDVDIEAIVGDGATWTEDDAEGHKIIVIKKEAGGGDPDAEGNVTVTKEVKVIRVADED